MEGGDTPRDAQRHTVAEAAQLLGITTGAVRNRLSRGTLGSVREGGTVYVLLPADMPRGAKWDTADMPGGIPHPDNAPLVAELRDRLRFVEQQLEAERTASAELRRIVAALTQRIPELEAPQEAPTAPRGSPTSAEAGGDRGTPPGQQQGQTSRARWWQRWFGA